MKLQRLTLEPFINAGYQKLDFKGDGKRAATSGAITNLWEMDNPVRSGLSVAFETK